MYDVSQENVVQVWRNDTETLLIVFSGIFALAGVAPFDFLKETDYQKSNLIYFKDFYRSGYKLGVSSSLPSLNALIEFCKTKIAEKQVKEVVVIGASSGALPALVCAHECNASHAWALGPRIPRDNLLKPMSHEGRPFSRWVEFKIWLYQKIARIFNRRAKDWFSNNDLDHALINKQVELLSNVKGVDENRHYKVFSVPENKVDTRLAKRIAECPGVEYIPVIIPAEYMGHIIKQSGWDHSVVQAMRLGKGLRAYMSS